MSDACLQRNEAIRLKEEYHAFRDRMAFMLFTVSLGLLVADYLRPHSERFTLTPPFMVCVQVFLCWLLYVYTALALRENVLKVCFWPHCMTWQRQIYLTYIVANTARSH